MPGKRDYHHWHRGYDDPDSELSQRLVVVQRHITAFLDATAPRPVRVLSSCAGDGRDLLGVLAERPDSDRVSATLLEIDPALAQRARDAAAQLAADVEVRTVDAGHPRAYEHAVPADMVLLAGIFGNIADADVRRLLLAAGQFCAPGAVLIWTRGRFENPRPG